jgi:hypothetical protein
MEQKGGSIQRIWARQSEQKPCSPSSENFSQQGHCGGRKNWKSVDRNPMFVPVYTCYACRQQEAAGRMDRVRLNGIRKMTMRGKPLQEIDGEVEEIAFSAPLIV